MLLLSEFFNVSRDAVKHWPSAPAWGRMNTFSYLIRRADLVESALGRSYDDYLKGYFWSRDWVLGGADPDKMEKEYGILAIEKNEIQFDGGVESGVKSAIHRLSVNCFLDRSCVDCPGGLRSVGEVESMLEDCLWVYLNYLYSVQKFAVLENGGANYNSWMTQGNADHLMSTGDFVSINPLGFMLSSYLAPTKQGGFDVILTDLEVWEKWRVCWRIVCGCI